MPINIIDGFIRADDPVSARESIWFKYIEGLFPYALDTRGEGKTQQAPSEDAMGRRII